MFNKFLVTYIKRGVALNKKHGGVYLVDFETGKYKEVIGWDRVIYKEKESAGGQRGLRGITMYKGDIYFLSWGGLHRYNSKFEYIKTYTNEYLVNGHELFLYKHYLFIVSTKLDTILVFNIEKERFIKGFHFLYSLCHDRFSCITFIPDIKYRYFPQDLDSFHLNSLFVEEDDLFVAGLATEGVIGYNSKKNRAGRFSDLPKGVHNITFLNDGLVLCAATWDGYFAIYDRKGNIKRKYNLPDIPNYDMSKVKNRKINYKWCKGLEIIDDKHFVGACSPNTVFIYNLNEVDPQSVIYIDEDVRLTPSSICKFEE